MARTFDPIELELLWRRLISAVDEAAVAMVRTSFSTLVRESYDFSCVITDETGQSLVQASESIPSFIGTLPETVKHFLRFFPPDRLEPGDVLITNDIWLGTNKLFVRRNERGTSFKKVVDAGKSITRDKRTTAKRKVRSGQGDKGDRR